MNNKVLVAGTYEQYEKPAAAAIQPGMIVSVDANNAVAPHAVADEAFCLALVAGVDSLQGNDLADDYAVGDQVKLLAPCNGGRAMLRCDDAAVTIGSPLTSAGNGTVQVGTAATAGAIAESKQITSQGRTYVIARF